MKSFYFLLFLLISISSCNSIGDKIKCLLENENIKDNVLEIINSFKSEENFFVIISKIIHAYTEIKDDVKRCLEDEPELKGGCRYEEQFKNCKANSCEYMDEYECMEYCYRKYC